METLQQVVSLFGFQGIYCPSNAHLSAAKPVLCTLHEGTLYKGLMNTYHLKVHSEKITLLGDLPFSFQTYKYIMLIIIKLAQQNALNRLSFSCISTISEALDFAIVIIS